MAIRCSLLGHDFGDPEVEREREEDGNEVVETVREVETCARCGKEKLISENKNVTTLGMAEEREGSSVEEAFRSGGSAAESGESDAASPGSGSVDAANADATESTGAPVEESDAADDAEEIDPDATDAEIIDGTADVESPAAEEARTDTAEDVITDVEGEPDPVEDDAVILDDDESEPARDRQHGEWPEADDTEGPDDAGPEPSAWPEQEGEDEGYDARIDDEEPEVEFGGGLTPEPADVDVDSDETIGGEPVEDTGITSADAAPSPDAPADTESVATEFFCPECGYAAAADRSSLRAGDICPECQRGYITERER
jgi:ssDNA-binding Zn-finger/Zn-ribbon topoisomerase 1